MHLHGFVMTSVPCDYLEVTIFNCCTIQSTCCSFFVFEYMRAAGAVQRLVKLVCNKYYARFLH